MAKIDFKHIIGTWLHSHEEDAYIGHVYRPKSFAFPKSRGRDGYEFHDNHTGSYIGIAARDGSEREGYTWRPHESTQDQLVISFENGMERVLTILALEDDRLVIK